MKDIYQAFINFICMLKSCNPQSLNANSNAKTKIQMLKTMHRSQHNVIENLLI